MKCDNFLFLLVRTEKSGIASIMTSSDNIEIIEDNYLYLCKRYAEEIASGLFRFDIYKAY